MGAHWRVGLFTESYDPVINGVSTSVKTLARELHSGGHHPIIVAPRFSGFTDEPSAGTGVDIRRLPSWRTKLNPDNPFAYPPVGPTPGVLRGLRFDLVHTQQPFGIGLHGRRVARQQRIPLVSTFHTLYHEYAHYAPFAPRRVSRQFVTIHLRRYYNGCDAVVVPSRAAGKILEGFGVRPDLVRVVPTGVPPSASVPPDAVEAVRCRYAIPPNAPVLLFVGRLAKEKNLGLLVDAFTRLCAEPRGETPILLIVGSGPYREECERLVTGDDIVEHVRFTGFLNPAQLAPVYAAATLFVFPSPTETQGVVLSEAQSHGLPCVVVDRGGAPEFVRSGVDALTVEPDVEPFVAAIRSLLDDEPRRRAFAAAARESPLHPTPESMARRMMELYAEVLNRGQVTGDRGQGQKSLFPSR